MATATDSNGYSVARSIEVTMVGTARSIEITKVSYHAWQLKSRVPMLPLVRCATISRQLGQGRRLRNRCFATATDINRCSVARSIEVTMVGRYHSIDRDYQGQLSRRLRSRVLMHAYATRGLRVSCALCNNFQAARPRQTTERRLAPLYDKS